MEKIISNAVIKDAQIKIDDRAKLTVWISLDYGGAGQCFGGYNLYSELKSDANWAGHFIYKCMSVVGVEEWDRLKGKCVRIEHDKKGLAGLIIAIGHIINDDWFNPSEDFNNINPELLK